MNQEHILHSALTALRQLGGAVQERVRRGLVLGGLVAMAFAGVVLWLAMHTPINDRWKANVAYVLAGVWGAAMLGYRHALRPSVSKSRR